MPEHRDNAGDFTADELVRGTIRQIIYFKPNNYHSVFQAEIVGNAQVVRWLSALMRKPIRFLVDSQAKINVIK